MAVEHLFKISRAFQIASNRPRGERSGSPVQTGAGMRAGTAEIQASNGCSVARPFQQRPRHEALIESQLGVEDVAAGQTIGALEIQRRDDLTRDDRGLEPGSVTRDRSRGGVAEPIALNVPTGLSATRPSLSRQVQSGSGLRLPTAD